MKYYELPKLPEVTDATDELKLWLNLFRAKTEEDLKRIEAMGVSIMKQAIGAYRTVTATAEFREIERLRSRARSNEASALGTARRKAEKAKSISIAKNMVTDNESVELSGVWKYKIGIKANTRPSEFFFQWQPIGNYNAMIAPVLKYPLKGVIWYQGESNTANPHEYAKLFRTMIQDWREKNKNENLPFLFVQLPIFGNFSDNNENHSWAIVRKAQADTLSLPATGMAAALELGEWNDIHPINKKDVGIRLFYAAEKTVFNVNNTSPGPVFKHYKKEENKIKIYFEGCGLGLKTADGKPYLSIIGENEQIRLPAEIEGADFITIDISAVKNPKKILYAWADNPKDRQLFNSDGLPVIPFMSEIS